MKSIKYLEFSGNPFLGGMGVKLKVGQLLTQAERRP